ncbi:MAG: RHS repeat-associated core domain-containing protein [Bacteroidales bacterium]|nr:RHS repeat-associated core domain-containing protein [Bacteroidales bacterium]
MLDDREIWTLTSHNTNTQGILKTENIGNNILKKSLINQKGALETVEFYSTKNNKTLSINQKYQYDKNMNITSRIINGKDQENFTYDETDRLTKYDENIITYSKSGNILTKTNIGDYEYTLKQPHALSFVSDPNNLIKPFSMTIEYTSFKKPSKIIDTKPDETLRTYTITYGPDQNRIKTEFIDENKSLLTYYLPDFEQENQNGQITTRHYIYSSAGILSAVNFRQGDKNETYLAITDNQGSITQLYDSLLRIKYTAEYSPFGVRTILENNLEYNFPRGYTMHEHLDEFGLINMNSRLYSPYLSRFLSPDPYIQDPQNSQNFNRYSYCLNNPLKYTDPSGEKWWHWALGAFLLDPITTSITACATATAAIGTYSTVVATGLIPFQGTLTAATIPSKNYWGKVKNAWNIDLGLFKSDSFGHLMSRFLWEYPQTGVGNFYSNFRNIIGNVDRVDYYKGATYCTNENSDKNDGVTLGNYININIDNEVTGDFENYLITAHNGLYMHEYGHTIQGRHYGFAYLFSVGLPSLFSAKKSHIVKTIEYEGIKYKISSHSKSWFEREASAYSRDYFGEKWTRNPIIEILHSTQGF